MQDGRAGRGQGSSERSLIALPLKPAAGYGGGRPLTRSWPGHPLLASWLMAAHWGPAGSSPRELCLSSGVAWAGSTGLGPSMGSRPTSDRGRLV